MLGGVSDRTTLEEAVKVVMEEQRERNRREKTGASGSNWPEKLRMLDKVVPCACFFLCFARMAGKVLFPRWTLDPRAGKVQVPDRRAQIVVAGALQ